MEGMEGIPRDEKSVAYLVDRNKSDRFQPNSPLTEAVQQAFGLVGDRVDIYRRELVNKGHDTYSQQFELLNDGYLGGRFSAGSAASDFTSKDVLQAGDEVGSSQGASGGFGSAEVTEILLRVPLQQCFEIWDSIKELPDTAAQSTIDKARRTRRPIRGPLSSKDFEEN